MNKLRFACLVLPLVVGSPAFCQSPPVIANVSPTTQAQAAPRLAIVKESLRRLGMIEGRHYVFESRYAEGNPERFPAMVKELMQSKPAMFLTVSPASIRAAQQAGEGIPILFVATPDPVGNGFVASLARPGGNITGLTSQEEDLLEKRMLLVREALPNAKRIAVLSGATPAHVKAFEKIAPVAKRLGMTLRAFDAASTSVLDAVFAEITQYRPDALLVVTYGPFYGEREKISAFALKSRIAMFAGETEFVDAGSLFAFGTLYDDLFRSSATYIQKILAGEKPATMAVAQPTKFELSINLRTAKALGIKVDQPLLLRADRVVD